MSRIFLLRLAFLGTGTFLLCAAGYLGLGWAVWSRQPWLHRLLGEGRSERRWDRLELAYGNAASALLSGDRDGDGFTDGYERFYRFDHLNPFNHPRFRFQATITSFDLNVDSYSPPSEPQGTKPSGDLLLVPGKTFRFRARLITEDKKSRPMAAGFRVEMSRPDTAPALVPVESSGWITLDLDLPANAETDWELRNTVVGYNPVTKERIFDLIYRCIHEDPPLPVDVVYSVADDPVPSGFVGNHYFKLRWPEVPASATQVMIEAAFTREDEAWKVVWIFPRGVTSCTMKGPLPGNIQDDGPLKFRAVPIR